MSCSCEIDVGHDCGPEVSTVTHPKARKSHNCCECHRVITKGETYELVKALSEGLWDTFKTCADCASVRDALFCQWYYEQMWDDVSETYAGGEPPSSDCMMQMTKVGRDRVCDIIESGWR
ncbi:MAG: hypothetical protein ACN4GW_22035 [Desulforhopalus sp.]